MFYHWSLFIKKHLLIDVRESFLNGIFCIEFADLKNRYGCKNTDFKSTYRRPNLVNDISNKTYRSSRESEEFKKL